MKLRKGGDKHRIFESKGAVRKQPDQAALDHKAMLERKLISELDDTKAENQSLKRLLKEVSHKPLPQT